MALPGNKIQDHTPWLKPVQIDDSATSTAGDIISWTLQNANFTTAPSPGTSVYGLAITTQAHHPPNLAYPGAYDADNFNNRVTGHFIAEKIWNSVWNDYADFQLLNDEFIPGKVYFDTTDGAMICNERCQLSVIGIASDTFAQVVGKRSDIKQIPIAVAGWVLAFVDKEYPCGTPLTNNENGELTEITLEEKRNYPERIVGIYKRKEQEKEFGTQGSKIQVNGRHWIKVK